MRDKARIYVNFKAKTPEDFAKKALDLKNQGYTAIRYSIGHPEDENGRCGENFSQVVYRMERQMAAIREAVGWETDIAIECHRGLTPAQAIECAHALKPYRPYFYEDPIPDNMAAMTKLTEEIDLPVATGERFINLMEFDEFMTASHVRYVRPDMCVAGGITAGKKIAALAEAKSIYIIPHNPLGPISTAACLQLEAAVCHQKWLHPNPGRPGSWHRIVGRHWHSVPLQRKIRQVCTARGRLHRRPLIKKL